MMFNVGGLLQKLRGYDAELPLHQLLNDADICNFLQNVYISIPDESKIKLQNVFGKVKTTTRTKPAQSAALTTVLELRSIALPVAIQDHFQLWKEDPSQFWMSHQAQLTISWVPGESLENAATNAYVVVQQLGERRPWDTILWRFYAIFFYMLGVMLACGTKNITDHMQQRVSKALGQSQKITDNIDVIHKNLRSWMAAGFKYHKICEILGKGALFLLPQIPDNVWEEEQGLKGKAFDQAMNHLEDHGIKKLSKQLGADKLSDQILNSALDSFRWETPLSIPPTQSVVAGARQLASSNSPNSINFLLNAAEYIEGSTQDRDLSSVAFTPDMESDATNLGTQRKRRCIETTPHHSSSHSRLAGDHGGQPLSPPKVSQVPGALQPGTNIARTAEVAKLEVPLGPCLFGGIDTSRMRHLEKERRSLKLTDTVRLHVPFPGEDFKLELWICASIGKAVLHATLHSAEVLENILDKFIFEGMTASKTRMEQARNEVSDFTGSVNVSCFDDDNDYRVEVMLGYETGNDILKKVFP